MKKNHVSERTDKPIAERYVSMSNALARSAQGLTLSEKRVVAMALAKTDSVPARDAVNAQFRNGWSVKLTAEEYIDVYQIDQSSAYDQLKSAADKLLSRHVRTMQQTPRGTKEVKTNWCGQCTYHHGEGWVEIAFTPQIAPHLLALRSKFTSYKLRQVSAMRSIYSWRLFECLQSWGDKGVWSPDIDTFAQVIEAPETCKSNFGQMRLRVIEPALKELREKDNFIIDLELKKAGRKVIGLVFRFKPNPQGTLDL
ncbi:MAG: replication initiation protein [Methylophilaceae bacterium]